MRDNPNLSPADRAVQYLLNRIQHDIDLRWLMLHTEAFALLCSAEAARTGENEEDVCDRREQDLRPSDDKQEPKLLRLRGQLQDAGIDPVC